jgi:hypothetical protein
VYVQQRGPLAELSRFSAANRVPMKVITLAHAVSRD